MCVGVRSVRAAHSPAAPRRPSTHRVSKKSEYWNLPPPAPKELTADGGSNVPTTVIRPPACAQSQLLAYENFVPREGQAGPRRKPRKGRRLWLGAKLH